MRRTGRSRAEWVGTTVLALLAILLAGCRPPEADGPLQGYAEGDFVYVASPLGGEIVELDVKRGETVEVGAPLFALECGLEQAARDEAVQQIAEAQARLADARRGTRPSEMESLEMRLAQTRTALAFAEKELVRKEELLKSAAGTTQDVDRARSERDQLVSQAGQLAADLETARLGTRVDLVAAAEAEVRVREAALARADWNLAQKKVAAPRAGLVFDTIYRQGEWVAAGRPVVSLLPPENMKVRAFVPETEIAGVQLGATARVSADGVAQPFIGRVAFISPQAEFTPPVIYSQKNRAKLVFLVEIEFDPVTAARLHPGQPVDIEITPATRSEARPESTARSAGE